MPGSAGLDDCGWLGLAALTTPYVIVIINLIADKSVVCFSKRGYYDMFYRPFASCVSSRERSIHSNIIMLGSSNCPALNGSFIHSYTP